MSFFVVMTLSLPSFPAETLLHYTLSAGKSTDSKSLDFFSLKTKKTAVFPYIFRKSCCIFLSVSLTFMQSASYQTGCCKDPHRIHPWPAILHDFPAPRFFHPASQESHLLPEWLTNDAPPENSFYPASS